MELNDFRGKDTWTDGMNALVNSSRAMADLSSILIGSTRAPIYEVVPSICSINSIGCVGNFILMFERIMVSTIIAQNLYIL